MKVICLSMFLTVKVW